MGKKKAQIDQLGSLAVMLVGIGIALVVGLLIMNEVKTQAIDSTRYGGINSTAANATEETMEAISDIPGWLPIIVITIIGAILIGLVAYFRRG